MGQDLAAVGDSQEFIVPRHCEPVPLYAYIHWQHVLPLVAHTAMEAEVKWEQPSLTPAVSVTSPITATTKRAETMRLVVSSASGRRSVLGSGAVFTALLPAAASEPALASATGESTPRGFQGWDSTCDVTDASRT